MIINFISTSHTALFSLSGVFEPSKMTPIHTRLQNAFFRAQLQRLGERYGLLVLGFQLIVFVEKVGEMWTVKRFGEGARWNVIVGIESVKWVPCSGLASLY